MNGFQNGLLNERPYSLTVNGRNLASIMMLPGKEKEFAVGYLATENIAAFSEIESVMLDSNTIGVLTTNPMKVLLPKKTVISGCGGTASYLDAAKMPKVESRADFNLKVPELNDEVVKAGGFCAALFDKDGEVAFVSDISQTVAVNKCVGAAIYGSVSLDKTVLAISGKVTGDIVRMCRFCGISKIVSVLPPTALAKEIADDGNVVLECIRK